MSLSTGTRLGVYEVTAQIGEGGMGQVYRARDTKLHRDVAIKVLPDRLASDTERLARFQREAQVLASLNHPNIAHIHGLEESRDVRALVMELVEGEDLSARMVRGAIPLEDVLPIAKQIADAVEAAHEQGIIHRDLKPANVKVRPDGLVKVLDFGLAKALSAEPNASSSRPLSMSATITSPAMMTGIGVILGTAAYMSPEQARGKPVDRRSDIWAFGCVLYEMLTGKAAFHGDGVTDTLAAVMRAEPDWSLLPAAVPPSIRALLHRCLQKDTRQRLQAIGDARIALEEVLTGAAPSMTAPRVDGLLEIAARRWSWGHPDRSGRRLRGLESETFARSAAACHPLHDYPSSGPGVGRIASTGPCAFRGREPARVCRDNARAGRAADLSPGDGWC